MALRKKIYRRVGAGGFSAFDYVRLYQGPDHLLEVHSFGYTETYRRYFFGDIQVFTIEKTVWGNVGNIVLSLAGGFLVLVVVAGGGGALAAGIIAGFFALFLLGNLALGPTCAIHVQTAVQRQRLRAITRVRTAHRLLKRLASQIQTAQGAATREQILMQLRQARLPAPQVPIEAPPVIESHEGLTG